MTSLSDASKKLFIPKNFTLSDFDKVNFGKKKNDGVIPLFAQLRALKRKDGSKITTHLYLKKVCETENQFLSFIDYSYEPTQTEIYQELVCRFIRKHKMLSVFSYLIEDCLHIRYRLHHRVKIQIPSFDLCCGWLEAKPYDIIGSTGNIMNVKNIGQVHAYRQQEINKLKKKRMQPTGALLVQWLLQTELTKLIKVKEHEHKFKQPRIRKQQSCSTTVQ
jgi:hypothetical protein